MNTGLSRKLITLTGVIGVALLLASPGVYADDTAVEESPLSVVSPPESSADEISADSLKRILLNREKDSQFDNIGMSAVPQFKSHGVIRTEDGKDKTPYFVLGHSTDDLTAEAGRADNDPENDGFSYGFGVSDSQSTFEYMMQVDEEDYSTEAVGITFSSHF